MNNQLALAALLLLLTACAPNLLVQTPTPEAAPLSIVDGYTISGSIRRGQSFSQAITPQLTFQLIPLQEGWEIWVGDPAFSLDATANFAMTTTPPFSAINARQVEGWHFRNLDNSGPNTAGEKNVNAPQEYRQFCFVGNQNDFQSALALLAEGLPALGAAVANEAFPIYSGMFTINNYTLGNLVPEQKAWFEQLEFTVTLNLDQPCDLL